jgi:hypothetical protein
VETFRQIGAIGSAPFGVTGLAERGGGDASGRTNTTVWWETWDQARSASSPIRSVQHMPYRQDSLRYGVWSACRKKRTFPQAQMLTEKHSKVDALQVLPFRGPVAQRARAFQTGGCKDSNGIPAGVLRHNQILRTFVKSSDSVIYFSDGIIERHSRHTLRPQPGSKTATLWPHSFRQRLQTPLSSSHL